MSEPKVQLIDPQGNLSMSGLSATGVITATSFDGVSNSSATSLTGTPDLDVGIVTATSFVGEGDGHAASLAGTPELNLGITTATSFIGDATGKAAGLRGTPNLNVGLITATSFVGFVTGNVTGNISGTVTGLGASVKSGANLGVGVCTALQYYGDGSSLTGAGSSAYIAQEVKVEGDGSIVGETIIDLSYGNVIAYKGTGNTTIGFASTSAAEQITLIRDTGEPEYTISYSTGVVTFDGSDDKLTLTASADLSMRMEPFTWECFAYRDSDPKSYSRLIWFGTYDMSDTTATGICFDDADYPNKVTFISGELASRGNVGSNGRVLVSTSDVASGQWYHIAVSRDSNGYFRLYIDGVLEASNFTVDSREPESSSTNTCCIGGATDSDTNAPFAGKISNVRIIKGTCLYTGETIRVSGSPLTNVTNTKLLCCQSDSSTTTGTVTPGTITAVSSPTASSATVGTITGTFNGTIAWPSRITWSGGSTPTLISNRRSNAIQIFHLTTVDTGLTYNGWVEISTNTQAYSLWSWGSSASATNDWISRSSPIQIPGDWGDLQEISGATNQPTGGKTVGVKKTDGTMWAWGYNYYGALGQNQAPAQLASVSSPIQLSGNWAATAWNYPGGLGTKTDGTLWVWGGGSNGANGTNNQTSYSSPTQVGTDTTWAIESPDLVFRGSASPTSAGICGVIKQDGTLWAWGRNNQGVLAKDDTTDRSSPTQIPGTWTKITGGSSRMYGIRYGTQLWAWGNGYAGQLGLNSTTSKSEIKQLPGTTWKDVHSGSNACLATKTDGTLWAWGANWYGSLGQNLPDAHQRSSPVQIPGNNWNKAAMGYGVCQATKTDGTLWVWGIYNGGALGQNTPGGSGLSSPTQIGTDTNWRGGVMSGGSGMWAQRLSP